MSKKEILSLDEIRELLRDRKLHIVGAAVGLSYPTIRAVLNNKGGNPTFSTQTKLSDYLRPSTK